MTPKKTKADFDFLSEYLKAAQLFNGNILVSKAGKTLFSFSHGYRSKENERTEMLNMNSVFELASVTKPFTAYATLVVCKEYGVDLQTDIRQFIPDLPYQGITIRHLLNHTSGLPDYLELFLQYWDKTRIAHNSDVLELLKIHSPDLLFPPGETWEYSNTGYVILAVLIERIAGKPYGQALKDIIFDPLNMHQSQVYNRRASKETIDNYALGYVPNPCTGTFEIPDKIPGYEMVYFIDGVQGDGTVNSTAGDLHKWNAALLNNQLPADVLTQMFTPEYTDENISYGMGWLISNEEKYGKIAHHNGGWPGYITYNAIYLDRDVSITMLCNQPEDLDLIQQILAAIVHITFDEKFLLPQRSAKMEQ